MQIKFLFGMQELLEIVQIGYEALGENHTEVQRNAFKDAKKKECKALFYIYQGLDSANFKKVVKVESSKEAYGIIVVELHMRRSNCNLCEEI